MIVIEWFGLRGFIKLLKVPKHIFLPIILVLCVVGAFGLSSRVFDVWTILIFGVVGYAFIKFKIPLGSIHNRIYPWANGRDKSAARLNAL